MMTILKKIYLFILDICRPALEKILLSNREKIFKYQDLEKNQHSSGMVPEFNLLHHWIYGSFFRRVRTVKTDIENIKALTAKGPIVYVLKNRGHLEYRYFNHLFLKEKIELVAYANNIFTATWRPFKQVWRYALAKLASHYESATPPISEDILLSRMLENRRDVLINLSISRDYLFGVFNSNPLSRVKPLLELQRKTDLPITIVPLQFLYDKHPEKTERSFFDLLFGEKSRPGALRKTLMFFMGLRKQPQAKFGAPIDLKKFLLENENTSTEHQTENLYAKIEETLSIERARITGPKLKTREAMLEGILKDSAFIANLKHLSQESGESYESLRKRTRGYLQEIAADVNYSYVQFAWLALNYLWNNIFDGLVIKHDQLNRIREIAGKNPVVLVPMHRSHIDYLLISHIFYANNITFPHVCAGINMNFWPVGYLVRKCAGFFIRRRFDDNHAYKQAISSYIKTLVDQGYCIEFFIEGTRSRTGKMLKPKFGILNNIVKAWLEGERDDVHFVPIAINYDQIIEQKSYASESAGADKKSEDAGQLLKARKVLGRKYGKVYVEFAEPLSLKSFLKNQGIEKKQSQSPDSLKEAVESFGYHLTYQMNKAAIVTPVSLASLALLSLERNTFTFEEFISRIHVLKDYLDFKDVHYSDLIHYSDRWAYGEALHVLKSRGVVKEVKTFEDQFYTLEPQHRGALDYYKNNILHFFVSLASFLKIAAAAKPSEFVTLEKCVKQYDLLKTLFRNDFTFSVKDSVEDHLRRVMRFCSEKGFIRTDAALGAFEVTLNDQNRSEFLVYSRLLDNFLESHLVTLRYLRHNRFENMEAKLLLKDMLERSKPLYLRDDLRHPESLNRFNLENSLKFAVDIGLVKSSFEAGKVSYTSSAETELIDKWIQSMQSYLNPAITPAYPLPPTVSHEASEVAKELH